jgi:hypothetical protein
MDRTKANNESINEGLHESSVNILAAYLLFGCNWNIITEDLREEIEYYTNICHRGI